MSLNEFIQIIRFYRSPLLSSRDKCERTLTSEESTLELMRVKYTNAVARRNDEAAVVLVEVDCVDLFSLFSGFHLSKN